MAQAPARPSPKNWTKLLNRGHQSDLPKFLKLLAGDDNDKVKIVALRAARKWGTTKQRKQAYLLALSGKSEPMAVASMQIFTERSPALREKLCHWVEHGRYQTTRLSAAKHLATFPTRHVVGCLILALRETFHPEPPDRHFVKYVAGFFTFGISFWASHRARKKRRYAFEGVITALSARLRQMSGVDFGNDYQSWLDWALRRGYTVGDMNLVQLLFSPYKSTRLRAQATAIDLLDDRGQQLARRHASDKDNGGALRLALAQHLMDAGLLAPRRIPLASNPAPVAPHSKRPVGHGCSGCRGCLDCRDCDVSHRGGHGIPLSWFTVVLWFWFRRRRTLNGSRSKSRRPGRLLLLPLTAAMLLGQASPVHARQKPQSREARLAAKILDSRDGSYAKRNAIRLGRIRTPAARKALLKLLVELEPLKRYAAIHGLLALRDATIAPVLLHSLRTGTFVSTAIMDGLVKDMALYYDAVAKALVSSPVRRDSAFHYRLQEVIGRSRHPPGQKLLQDQVRNKGIGHFQQYRALEVLIEHWGAESKFFIRGLVAAPKLGDLALKHVLRTATAADLPLFRKWANRQGSGRRVAGGFSGIQRFGDPTLRQRIFMRELQGKSTRRAHLAMLSFMDRTPALRAAICRIARRAGPQYVRLTAAYQLIRYDTPQVIPCLVPILREEYAGRDGSSILHGVLAFLTVGITAVAIDASKARSIKGFSRAKGRVAKRLAQLSGVDHATDYWRWRDWAAEQGYTVEGRNLLQVLLSSNASRRARAQTRALTVLGYGDRAQFLAKHPLRGRTFSLALVAQLQKRGHLKTEPLPAHDKMVPDQIPKELRAQMMKMRDDRSAIRRLLGCSCRSSDPGGGLLFVLVVGVLLWLRRRRQSRSGGK